MSATTSSISSDSRDEIIVSTAAASAETAEGAVIFQPVPSRTSLMVPPSEEAMVSSPTFALSRVKTFSLGLESPASGFFRSTK